MLATTVAWDTSLSWTWAMAIDALQATMCQVHIFGLTMIRYWVFVFYTILFMHSLMKQVSAIVVKLRKEVPKTYILSNNHIPSKTYWDLAVNRALQLIDTGNSALIKVLNNLSAELLFSISFWGFHFLYLWTSILSWKFRLYLHEAAEW